MGHNRSIRGNAVQAVAPALPVAQRPLDQRVLPLEPRILLDANLEWDLNSTSVLTSALSGVAQIFEEQIDDINAFLDGFADKADAAFSAVDTLVDTAGDVSSTDLNAVTETVDRLREAITALRDGAIGDIDAMLGGTFAQDVADSLNAQLDAADTSSTAADPYNASFTIANIASVYTLENFSDGTVNADRTALLTAGDLGSTSVADAEDMFDTAVANALGLPGNNFSVTLTDQFLGTQKIVDFEAGATAGSVAVSIALPEAVADFGEIVKSIVPGITLPFELLSSTSGTALSFDLTPKTDITGDVINSIGLDINGFDFAPLLEVGGSFGLPTDAGLKLGFLELEATALETAKLGLFVDVDPAMNLGGELNFTSGLTYFGASATIGVDAQIQEVGAAAYTDIVADQVYDLLSLETDGTLAFGSSSESFGADLLLSSIVDTTSADGRLAAFLSNASFTLDIDLSATSLSPEVQTVLEETIETLAAMGTGEIINFLKSTGEAVAGALQDAAFDVDIPLTDLNLSDVTTQLAGFFNGLADRFSIAKESLGFIEDSEALSLTRTIDAINSTGLTTGQLDALAGYSQLTFSVLDGSGTPINAVVSLASTDVVNTALDAETRMNALITLLTTALGAYGFTFSLGPNNGLRVQSAEKPATGGNPPTYNTFAILEALRTNGTTDDEFGLGNLGFDTSGLAYVQDAFGDGTTENVLNFLAETTSAALAAVDISDLAGVNSLRFVLNVDGQDQALDVEASSASGWGSLGDLISDFNLAFDAAGVGVTVGDNGAGGFNFALDAGEERSIGLTTQAGDLLRALDLDGLIGWVNAELTKVLPGAELELTDDGALIFHFPDLEMSQSVTAADGLYFNTEELGLGLAENLTLAASLFANINATFTSAVGIDIVGFGKDLVGGGSGNALEEKSSFSGTIADAVQDNVFLTDLSLSAQMTGGASSISGTADLGLVSIAIGADTPTANFLVADLQLEATLIGSNLTDGFNDRITYRNLFDAVADKFTTDINGDVVRTEAPGLTSLLGRYDLMGGIVVDGDGQGLNASGNAITSAAEAQVVDAFAYTGSDDLAQLLVKLGDVKITVAGIPGINEDLIDGIGLTILDLRDIQNTFDVKLLSDDPAAQDAIDGLTALKGDDILDSLTAIANMLVVVGETLSDRLPFLVEDIPLLNFSILDTINFAADFLEALQELRRDPQAALDVLEGYLEQAFGPDTVTLTWDGANSTILFDLELKFLDDVREELPFQLDLVELLGSQLETILPAELVDTVSSLVSAGGEGSLVFDPLLSLNFSFGIDLRPTLAEPTDLADANEELAALASVSSINFRAGGGNDLRIVRTDADTGTSEEFSIDLSTYTTLDAVVAAINTQAQSTFGATTSFTYDAATGQITLADTENAIFDATGLNALFGGEQTAAAGEIAFDGGFSGFAAAHVFTLEISGEKVEVSLAADAARTDADAFALAFNAALQDLDVDRSVVSDTAAPILKIALSQLLTVVNDAGTLKLQATNFTAANGYGDISFAVSAQDISKNIEFRIEELGGSNLARALGLPSDGETISGDVVGEVLYEAVDRGAPRVFLDTDPSKTGIKAEFVAGIADGLNVELGLGPIKVNVVDGRALINAGDGSGDGAYFQFFVNDIDGTADGEYDLGHIFEISDDPALGFADLFGFDTKIGIDVVLPLSDSLGLFDPTQDMLVWQTELLGLQPSASWDTIDFNNLGQTFSGDLISLYEGNGIDMSNFQFVLPDLGDFLSNLNVLALLNDPVLVLEGVDAILSQMQRLFDDFLGDINLPVVGDAIGAGVTFFDEFRYKVIEPALAAAETPKADGSLPTTVDLLTGFINDKLNEVLGTTGQTYLQAYLDTSGSTDESYIYGVLNFNGIIFDEMMDIDFDFGIPGFNLNVEKGSQIRMTLDYAVNIGFGYDRNGFFLLNDTDQAETGINFTVDAGSFEGSMKVFNILGIDAEAVTLDGSGNITSTASSGGGTAQVTAALTGDLFGDTGLDITSGTPSDGKYITSTQAYRNFDQVTPMDGLGNVLDFEKVVYAAQLDSAKLIEFAFSADIDLAIGLSGNILDPTTGNPIEIGGIQAIPSVAAEVVIKGGYSTAAGLQLTELAFKNVRLDASVLYDAIIAPVLEPIMDFVEPLAEFFAFLNSDPVKIIIDLLGNVFPILRIASTVISIGDAVSQFVVTLAQTGGWVLFGDFDFTGQSDDVASGNTSINKVNKNDIKRGGITTAASAGPTFGVFGDINNGLSIEIPLLTNPFSAMDILLGNYDQVDLIKANFTLFNLNTGVIDIADEVLSSFGAPGWVRNIISSVFSATIEARLIAKFTAGYDLSGIVNFANTLEPERLLDGVFIDAAPGALVDVYIGASFGLNAGIAGLNASGNAGVTLTFNDPNGDGKLRIPELIAIVDAAINQASNPLDSLGYIFSGTATYGFSLSIWAGINLPWPLPDLKWSTTVFNISDSISFGGNAIPARISSDTSGGAMLNIGAMAGANMTSLDSDGNDAVTISGTTVSVNSGGKSIGGSIAGNSAVIIPAGEGNNTVNLAAMTTPASVTYTGSGRDTVTVARSGTHVIFAGEGDDIIQGTGASGTYIIFGQGGTDTVNIDGGNVIYFGDDDFGVRDQFQNYFSKNAMTEDAIKTFFGLAGDGTMLAAGAGNFDTGSSKVNIAGLANVYTALTQLNAENADESVTVGSGNSSIFLGSGDDTVTAGVGGTGAINIFAGDGSDKVTVGGSSAFVEAGADRDLVIASSGSSEIWGWGRAAGVSGLDATDADTNALAIRDGTDILIGGAGNDSLYGQIGNEIIEGGLGNDEAEGGIGDDIIVGGTMRLEYTTGVTIDISTFDLDATLLTGLLVSAENQADGNDLLTGHTGFDILIGGGGNDTIRGEDGNDILLGDFGQVTLSSNLVAEGVTTQFDTSAFSGTDELDGGMGNDILAAGAAALGQSETLVDMFGDNIFLGDFGVVEGARVLDAATKVESTASTAGGADAIISGRGNDLIIGGEGDDTINSGLGGDLILGDNGALDITAGTVTGLGLATDGNDEITVGIDTPALYGTASPADLKDVIIGGLASDVISAQAGGLALLADAGVIQANKVGLAALRTYTPLPANPTQDQIDSDTNARNLISFLAESLTGTSAAGDGDDQVTTTGGEASLVLGGGSDQATLGDGVTYVLGDTGTLIVAPNDDYSAVTATLTSAASAAATNDDQITTGLGNTIIVGGEGGDQITTGNGDQNILGDRGSIVKDDTLAEPTLDLVSAAATGDGDDNVTLGEGQHAAILGGGGDSLLAGDGGSSVIGDSGTLAFRVTSTTATTSDPATGGDDSITTGADADVVIGGAGGDTVEAGEGDNAVIGDNGVYARDTAADTLTLTSSDPTEGGNDSITAGAGLDRVIGGIGDDTIEVGAGDNIVIGDNGTMSLDPTTLAARSVQTTEPTIGGADVITTLEGNDVVLAGAAGDSVDAGEGQNIIAGDHATYTPGATESTLASTDTDQGGDDSLVSGSAEDIVIGGLGADTVEAGAGDNTILGDSGTILFTSAARAAVEMRSAAPSLGGNDEITTLGGADAIIGGAGGDVVDAGDGANTVLGDNGEAIFTSVRTVTSSDAGIGGNDQITTGADADVVIGGTGADTVEAGDGGNAVIGDNGTYEEDTTAQTLNIFSSDPTDGGDDSIVTGLGADTVVAGFGGDTVEAGEGNNAVIGDNGRYALDEDADTLNIFSTDPSEGGDDSITAGAGIDLAIGGIGDDTIEVGAGDNIVIGDNGTMSLDPTTLAARSAQTTEPTIGGADIVTTLQGNDVVLAGAAGDTVTTGGGADTVLGDHGSLTRDSATDVSTLQSSDPAIGGDDSIFTGTEGDLVIAGGGSDTVDLDSGDNTALGDNGVVTLDTATGRTRTFDTSEPSIGGADVITSKEGRDIIAGGALGDTIVSGAGEDVILGDTGSYQSAHVTGTGSLTSEILSFGGDDSIQSEDGNDLILAGLGNDIVEVGNGDDLALGDDGTVTFVNFTDPQTILATNPDLGGNDTVTADGTIGDNILFGQAGADSVIGGETEDIIIGDLALIELSDANIAITGQSAVDRLTYIEGIRPDIAFDDELFGQGGRDLIWGGFGDDDIFGGDDQDILIGDTAILTRTLTPTGNLGLLTEDITIDTNFAFLTGGYDEIDGQGGADIQIGNLGPDLFFGNTETDLIFSDAYAGIFISLYSTAAFQGPTPQINLLTSNFAGFGATDVVSSAQQDDSIGSNLGFLGQYDRLVLGLGTSGIGELFSASLTSDEGRNLDETYSEFVDLVLDFLSSDVMIAAMAKLLEAGADPELVRAAILNSLLERFLDLWDGDALQFERVMNEMIDFILTRVSHQANLAPADVQLAMAAE